MSYDSENWRGYEWTALSVTTVGALLASIQGSALIIALPDILTHLQANFLTIMWVLLGYLLITTAVVPVVGRLADMFGRKNLYNAGFAIFTLGSLLCGLSQSRFHGWNLVGYRLIQGVGGALLFTNSAAIVTDAFRHGRIGLGLGVNQIAAAAGFLVGPVVGGSGLFASPNTNAIMSSVPPEKRGMASGINVMLMNTGSMLSIAIGFPLVLSAYLWMLCSTSSFMAAV